MAYSYTTQPQVRRAFWESGPEGLSYVQELAYKRRKKEFRVDIRMAFVDFVDALQRNGNISAALAQRVTLEGRI